MSSFGELARLQTLVDQQQADLAKEMTVKDIVDVIKNADEKSDVEVDVATKAVQMILEVFTNYLNAAVEDADPSVSDKTIDDIKAEDLPYFKFDPELIKRVKEMFGSD